MYFMGDDGHHVIGFILVGNEYCALYLVRFDSWYTFEWIWVWSDFILLIMNVGKKNVHKPMGYP